MLCCLAVLKRHSAIFSFETNFLTVLNDTGMRVEHNCRFASALAKVVGVSDFPSELLFEKIFCFQIESPAPSRPRQLRKFNSEQAILAAFEKDSKEDQGMHEVLPIPRVEGCSSSSSQHRSDVVLSRPENPKEIKMLKRLNSEQAMAEYMKDL